jgi:hypothetical protein
MTRGDSGKCKRGRNNPQVGIEPRTLRGKITGPQFAATARILPPDWPWARKTIERKYWLATSPVLMEQKEPVSGNLSSNVIVKRGASPLAD